MTLPPDVDQVDRHEPEVVDLATGVGQRQKPNSHESIEVLAEPFLARMCNTSPVPARVARIG